MNRLTKAASIIVIGLAMPATGWAQYNPFTANSSGTQFFSQVSADGASCNVGFFAQGGYGPCANEATGTSANQGLVTYDRYWGTDGNPPVGITWGANVTYELTLVGSVAGGTSQIGWWYRDVAGGYFFTMLPDFGSKLIGSSYILNSPTTRWGLFIANNFNPEVGGCNVVGPVNYYCSDASGGFSFPTQQWALLANLDPAACGGLDQASTTAIQSGALSACWLWGAEDNKLEFLPNGFAYDSDYNDYMIAMRVSPVPEPLTMGLMATGLVAMVGVGFVQRRRKNVA